MGGQGGWRNAELVYKRLISCLPQPQPLQPASSRLWPWPPCSTLAEVTSCHHNTARDRISVLLFPDRPSAAHGLRTSPSQGRTPTLHPLLSFTGLRPCLHLALSAHPASLLQTPPPTPAQTPTTP